MIHSLFHLIHIQDPCLSTPEKRLQEKILHSPSHNKHITKATKVLISIESFPRITLHPLLHIPYNHPSAFTCSLQDPIPPLLSIAYLIFSFQSICDLKSLLLLMLFNRSMHKVAHKQFPRSPFHLLLLLLLFSPLGTILLVTPKFPSNMIPVDKFPGAVRCGL